ncbi:MAG TPA: acylphosphatase [Acidimicrobiia bacterium]|nr:acylphosphatase [Acidimicrobiia bacterium]
MTQPASRPAKRQARVRVVVSGRVQGVWFRDTCRDEARVAAVSGWVRNNHDGTVEAVFEGPPAAVDSLVEWCRSGPPRAQVEGVALRYESPIGEVGFRVR